MNSIEALDSLYELMEKPERHDSPIGVLSRMYMKNFIQKHGFDEVDEQAMIQTTSERIFSKVARKAGKLEDKILSESDDQEVIRKIQWARNERKLEAEFRKSLLEKA